MSGGIQIKFRPSIKQDIALNYLMDDETLFVGYGGSAFSGKSYLLCYWLTIMSIGYPETSWGLGRRELVNLKKTTLVTLFKVFQECNIKPDKDFKYNQQDNVITFSNGSRIYLIDTAYKPSDPLYTRFGGLELTGAAIDESAETNHKAIDILFTRLGRKNNHLHGLKKKLLETFNPAKNHVYTRYYKPYKDGKNLEGHVFVPALPKDNPSPEVEEYIRDIVRTADEITIQRLIYGNFEYDNDPAKLIEYDKIINTFSNSFVEHGEKYISADIARFGSDKAVIIVWSGYRAEKIVSFAKSSITDLTTAIKKLMLEYSIPVSNVIADEDGVGGGIVDVLGCKGFVNGGRPMDENNQPAQYQNLKSQCYFHLAKLINEDRIYINASAEDKESIIPELEQVKRHNIDSDGKLAILPKEKVKELLGRSPDFADALMMRMYFDLKSQKEVFFF